MTAAIARGNKISSVGSGLMFVCWVEDGDDERRRGWSLDCRRHGVIVGRSPRDRERSPRSELGETFATNHPSSVQQSRDRKKIITWLLVLLLVLLLHTILGIASSTIISIAY